MHNLRESVLDGYLKVRKMYRKGLSLSEHSTFKRE